MIHDRYLTEGRPVSMNGLEALAARTYPLTLKTIYRMLTQPDFPIHSYIVFPESSLQGQTVNRFWFTLFQAGLPVGTDLSVFDASQKRSRTLTKLINNTGASQLMVNWFEALSSALTANSFLTLARAWMDRLEQWHYAPKALNERLLAYVKAVTTDEALRSFFLRQALELSAKENRNAPLLFSQSVLLGWLTLYALYGSSTQDVRLARLRAENEASLSALYGRYLELQAGDQPQVITTRRCALCVRPLPPQAYFGQEAALEKAEQELIDRGKVLICGLGGIGKTELTRQLLARLIRQRRYSNLAYVQYENSLESSYRVAFPSLRDAGNGAAEAMARHLLEENGNGKTLLLIDNVNEIPARDAALSRLSEYGCDVIVTSRLSALEGFSVVFLSGLDTEDSRRLFYYHARQISGWQEMVDELCDAVAGHPLAIVLFASLCRSRFWPVDKLVKRLREGGLSGLSYVHQASQVNLEDVFSNLFLRKDLSREQGRLLELLSLLTYRYWLPEELLPWTRDIFSQEDALADACRSLSDLGWLLCGDVGFAVHPIIAETVRLQPTDAGDYPLLWQLLDQLSEDGVPLAHQAIIGMILHMKQLSLSAVRCLAGLEQRIGFISYQRLPDEAYEIHRRFLDAHAHEAADETDYWLGQAIRDAVVFSRTEHLGQYLHTIMLSDGGAASVRNAQCMYTLLELLCASRERELAEQGFAWMRSKSGAPQVQADYLISYSVKQRRMDGDPKGAEASLRQAAKLLEQCGQQHTLRQADLNYRLAVCLLDLGRPQEAKPLLEDCLQIMKSLGRPDNTDKMMSTRTTYAVVLGFLNEYEAALQEYEYLASLYRDQGREESAQYAVLMNNTAIVLDSMKRFEQAEKTLQTVIRLDEALNLPMDIQATHHRNMAFILSHAAEYEKAGPFAAYALQKRQELFGSASPWTADAQAVYALILAFTGQKEAALEMIETACDVLKNSWGSGHRHTRNAENNRSLIQGIG